MAQHPLFNRSAAAGPATRSEPIQACYSSWLETPLGTVEIVTDGHRVLTIEFSDETVCGEPDAADRVGALAQAQLAEYFAGMRSEFTVPVRLSGTPFQLLVWEELQRIEYGQTICYSELAHRCGIKNGQRAVGMANRQNPIAIIVPCHRVIQADGALCGYAGGLWRKQRLLGIEFGQHGLF